MGGTKSLAAQIEDGTAKAEGDVGVLCSTMWLRDRSYLTAEIRDYAWHRWPE